MAPWEIMISESQERMLVVVSPEKVETVCEILKRHEVNYGIVGEVIEEDRYIATNSKGEVIADLEASFLVDGFPEYHTLTMNFVITDELAKEKDKLMDEFFNAWKATLTADDKIITIDGYKVQYPDNSWIIFRPSGTEPKIRIYADAKSKKRCQELAEKGVKMFTEITGID